MVLFGYFHIWPKVEECRLFKLRGYNSVVASRVAGQSSFYDRQSDLDEIYSQFYAYIFLI